MNFKKEIVPMEKKTKVVKDLIKKVFTENKRANQEKITEKPCKKPTYKKVAYKKWINL